MDLVEEAGGAGPRLGLILLFFAAGLTVFFVGVTFAPLMAAKLGLPREARSAR